MKSDFEKLVIAKQYVGVLEAENAAFKEVIVSLEQDKKHFSADMQQLNQEVLKLLQPGNKAEDIAFKQNLKIRYLTKQVQSLELMLNDYKQRYREQQKQIKRLEAALIVFRNLKAKEASA